MSNILTSAVVLVVWTAVSYLQTPAVAVARLHRLFTLALLVLVFVLVVDGVATVGRRASHARSVLKLAQKIFMRTHRRHLEWNGGINPYRIFD